MASNGASIGFLKRLLANFPDMLQSGFDAAATPNIAGGGATDVFRALSNSGNLRAGRNAAVSKVALDQQEAQLKAALEQRKFEMEQAKLQEEISKNQASEESTRRERQRQEDELRMKLLQASREGGTLNGVTVPGSPVPTTPLTAAQGALLKGEAEVLPNFTPPRPTPLQVPPMGPVAPVEQGGNLSLPITPGPLPLGIRPPTPAGYSDVGLDAPRGGGRLIAPTAATKAQAQAKARPTEPLVEVMRDGKKVYVPRTEAVGQEVPDDAAKLPTTEFQAIVAKHTKDGTVDYDAVLKESQERETALRRISAEAGPRSPSDDIGAIAEAIVSGRQPPVLTGLYRDTAAVRAALERDYDYDLATATNDWTAVQRTLTSLNGAQQTRLRQAITFTHDSLPLIRDLYSQWQSTNLPSGFKLYNKAALEAAANLPGEAGSAASNLKAQIADLVSELAVVFRGGNASTDESIRLAAENLKGEWNPQTFNDAIRRLDQNLTIRRNSIYSTTPVGVTADSPYVPRSLTGAPTEQFPGAPAIGTVVDGYEYTGGNPNQQSSWREVRQ